MFLVLVFIKELVLIIVLNKWQQEQMLKNNKHSYSSLLLWTLFSETVVSYYSDNCKPFPSPF